MTTYLWIILARKKRTRTWEQADTWGYKGEKQATDQAQEYAEDEPHNEFGVVEIPLNHVKVIKVKKETR